MAFDKKVNPPEKVNILVLFVEKFINISMTCCFKWIGMWSFFLYSNPYTTGSSAKEINVESKSLGKVAGNLITQSEMNFKAS